MKVFKRSFLVSILIASVFSLQAQPSILQWQHEFDTTSESVFENFFVFVYGGNKIVKIDDNNFVFAFNYNNDVKIIKVDGNGILLWQSIIGGSGTEGVGSIKMTADGGFIVAGGTNSNDGLFTGNHGSSDGFLAKLDNAGNVQWVKLVGTSVADGFNDVQVLSDGYVGVGGTSEAIPPAVNMFASKVDLSGNIIWTKSFGVATKCDKIYTTLTDKSDNVYLGGVFEANCDITGSIKMLLIKLDNQGNQLWRNDTMISNGLGLIDNLSWNADTTQIISAVRRNNINGITELDNFLPSTGAHISEKTINYLLTNDIGPTSIHRVGTNYLISLVSPMFKIGSPPHVTYLSLVDGQGNILFSKNMLGNETIVDAVAVPGGYILLSSFDGSHPYVKISKLSGSNIITGRTFLDANFNGIFDLGDQNIDGVQVVSTKNTTSSSSFSQNGTYIVNVDTGTIATAVQSALDSSYNITPSQKTINFTNYFNIDTVDFALVPKSLRRDLEIELLPLSPVRPGFNTIIQMVFENNGNVTMSNASIKLVKDYRLTLADTSIGYAQHIADTLIWNLQPLAALEKDTIKLLYNVPVSVSIGDTITTSAAINPIDQDLTPLDNTSTLRKIITGSNDPNDKQESSGGLFSPAQLSAGNYLVYTINFQNAGSDTAFNIVVRDTLGNNVDWSSLQMINSSHNNSMQVKDGNKLSWTFNNIKLPDSNHNEPASHGYIAYRIKPKNSLITGDSILNTASVYFDFNPPSQTNTEKTIISDGSSILCPGGSITLSSKIAGSVFQWQLDAGAGYTNISDNSTYQGTNLSSLLLTNLPTSMYGYKFRCVVDGSSFSPEYVIEFQEGWNGSVSKAWEDPSNWSCGIVPDANIDVIINAGPGNAPEVNSNASCRSITIRSNATILVKSGFNLTIKK